MKPLVGQLTDWLRNQSTDQPAFRTAYRLEVHVHVNWPYLNLPITLTLLSCILLISTIVSSNETVIKAWKSNSLAPLFHGLGDLGGETSPLLLLKQMETAAKHTHVHLESEGCHALRIVILQMQEPSHS